MMNPIRNLMRRHSETELAALCLGTLLVIGGAVVAAAPHGGAFLRSSGGALGETSSYIHVTTPAESRMYGMASVLVGLGIAGFTLAGREVIEPERRQSSFCF